MAQSEVFYVFEDNNTSVLPDINAVAADVEVVSEVAEIFTVYEQTIVEQQPTMVFIEIPSSQPVISSFPDEELHVCHSCGHVFTSHSALIVHERVHAPKNPDVATPKCLCDTCGKPFDNAARLASHMLSHTKSSEPVVDFDRTTVNNIPQASRTRLTQSKEKTVSESNDSNETSEPVESKEAGKHLGAGAPKPFQCELCLKTFPKAHRLSAHMIRHKHIESEMTRQFEVRKPFACAICEKRFVTPKAVRRHMLVHSEERNYLCPICNKGFKHPTHVTQHLGTHSDRGLYECVTCAKVYKRSDLLVDHTRHHADDEKHFLCGICQKHYNANDLITHFKNRHVDYKPIMCGICGASFTRKYDFTRHVKERVGH